MKKETTRCAALFRGINVGRAKRVAMADLRSMFETLGYSDVRTVLNSGNVVFNTAAEPVGGISAVIEAELERTTGISARVTVLSASDLAAIVERNPLGEVATNPSRLLVALFREPADLTLLAALEERDWSPDRLALGNRAAYLWCPNGVLESPIPDAVARLVGDGFTTRNWATILKLHGIASPSTGGTAAN